MTAVPLDCPWTPSLMQADCGFALLTVYAKRDALGNRWGHPVGGDAQIGAHLVA